MKIIAKWLEDRATRKRVDVLERKLATLYREHYQLCLDHEELFTKLRRLEDRSRPVLTVGQALADSDVSTR